MAEIVKQYAGGIYKMAGGKIASVLPSARLGKADESEMSVPVIVCTNAIDRDRERILPKGITTLNHSRNPQVDFQHDTGLAVGMARVRNGDGYTGEYTVKLDPAERLVAKTFFHQNTEIGNQVFEMVVKGALPGVSLTMLPVPNLVKKYDARDGGRPITVYEAGDLVAYSHVWQPSNPECLAEIVHKGLGGKPLCRELFEKCGPLVGERNPVVVGGWDSIEAVRKYLPPDQEEPNPMDPPMDGQDPNADPAAQPDNHHANVTDGIGTAMASIWAKFADKTLDRKAAGAKFDKLMEAHEHATDMGDGPDLGNDEEEGDAMDDEDDSDSDEFSGQVEGEDDDDDYEDDDENPGKKKYLLGACAVTKGEALAFSRTFGVTLTDVAEHFAATDGKLKEIKTYLEAVVKFHSRRNLNPAKAAAEAERLLPVVSKLVTKTAKLGADMHDTFAIVRKNLVKSGVVMKAKAVTPAEAVPDAVDAAELAGLMTKAQENGNRIASLFGGA
jgi:hypothetical protein